MSIIQERAIDLLITGKNDDEVAQEIGAHRVTVTRWRLYHPGFQAALNARREAVWSASQDLLRVLVVQAMVALAEDLKAPGPLRSKVALEIIKLSRFGAEPVCAIGPTDPEVILEHVVGRPGSRRHQRARD